MMDIRNIDIEKVAKALELDAGQTLPGLRESLAQAKRGEFSAVHTPEMIAGYRARGRPTGRAGAFSEVLSAAWTGEDPNCYQV